MTSSGKLGFCTSCRSLVGRDDDKSCPDCSVPLVMLQDELPEKDEQSLAPDAEPFGRRVMLSPDSDISFGTHNDCSHRFSDPMNSDFQASLVYHEAERAYWIIDYGTQSRTWVNGNPVKKAALAYGDRVQVGSAAWTYLRVDQGDQFEDQLEPVSLVDGATVQYYRHREARQYDKVLEIKPGEFVAVIGASGSGKSTLLKTLIGKDVPDDVCVIVQDRDGKPGIDVSRSADALHKVLGYVSQESIIHDSLSAREILYQAVSFADPHLRFRDAFVAGLKRRGNRIAEALLQLGVPEETGRGQNRWGLEFRQLSGGEQKRVRTAHELIRQPKLLLLDEPGSGLDEPRERELMLRLKHLSHCGITVVIVLHKLSMVQYCDRFFWFDNLKLTHQGAGKDFDTNCDYTAKSPTAESLDLVDRATMESNIDRSPAIDVEQMGTRVSERLRRWWAQGGMLLRREFKLSAKSRRGVERSDEPGRLSRLFGRLFHPLVFWFFWMPLAFALIIGISVPSGYQGDKNLLGFLSVLAVIWMGASLGVRRIVDEREIFEHEHLIFLRTTPYVLAKVVCYSLLAIPQTIVYVTLLYAVRWCFSLVFFFQASDFPGVLLVVVWALLPVTLAGVGAGLFISAIANHDENRPNQFLPILMVCQIIFSATIMINNGARMELDKKYYEFHAHQCEVHREEGLPATSYDRQRSLWLCDKCHWKLGKLPAEKQSLARDELIKDLKREVDIDERMAKNEKQASRAHRLGAAASYLMISRWGDLALHSTVIRQDQDGKLQDEYQTAYHDNYKDPTEGRLNKEFVDRVRTRSRRVLFGIYLGLIFSTIWVLKYQVRRKPKPDPEND